MRGRERVVDKGGEGCGLAAEPTSKGPPSLSAFCHSPGLWGPGGREPPPPTSRATGWPLPGAPSRGP